MVVCPGSGEWIRPLERGLDPGRIQPRNQPLNHLVPGVVPTLPPTLEPTSRKRNPPWNRLHGRETRPPSKNVMSQSVQRKHPFPSHDEDLACVTMGNFFVPKKLCCVFLRESLPSLPTNKTLLLFPRKAVGALGHHLATAGTLAPQPPTHRRSGPRVLELRTSLIQTGAKLSTRGLGADFLIQLRATRLPLRQAS